MDSVDAAALARSRHGLQVQEEHTRVFEEQLSVETCPAQTEILKSKIQRSKSCIVL